MSNSTHVLDNADVSDYRLDGRSLAGLAVLAAAVLLSGVGLLGARTVAGPDTRLQALRGAVLVVEDGRPHPATDGEVLTPGARVSTGGSASAVLDTGGRTVELGPGTILTMIGPQRQLLDRGAVLIDRRTGPALVLATDSATVRPDGLARVSRTGGLRVVSYRGPSMVEAVARRAQAVLPALHELQVPLGGVPRDPSVLHLTPGDVWEKRPAVAGAVVAGDDFLQGLATGIDLAREGAQRVPARVRATAPVVVGGASEQVLGYAIAQAAGGAQAYPLVRGDRDTGGSWGVIAALRHADRSRVVRALDALLGGATPADAPGGTAGGLSDALSASAGGPGSRVAMAPGTSHGPTPPEPTSPGPTSPEPTPPGPAGQPAPGPGPTAAPGPTVAPRLPSVPLPLPEPVPVPGLVDAVTGTVLRPFPPAAGLHAPAVDLSVPAKGSNIPAVGLSVPR